MAIGTVLENFIPPVPADAVVTLAGFLTQRGATTPLAVFVAAWGGSAGGAILIYWVARRYGRAFFASRTGRRLLTPDAIAWMERGYLRLGMIGIFTIRLLPGLRSVVAPFSGIVALPPLRALVPMILASGLWYGFLTLLGARLGAEWERIKGLVAGINTTLGILAAVVTVGLVVWFFLRRKRRRRERLWDAFHDAFQGDPAGEVLSHSDPAVAAVGALLLALARTDGSLAPEDRERVVAYVRDRWQLSEAAAGHTGEHEPVDPAEFARVITGSYGRERRVKLARRLWWHAFRDGLLRHQEDRVMRRAAELLGLSEEDLAEARQEAEEEQA